MGEALVANHEALRVLVAHALRPARSVPALIGIEAQTLTTSEPPQPPFRVPRPTDSAAQPASGLPRGPGEAIRWPPWSA